MNPDDFDSSISAVELGPLMMLMQDGIRHRPALSDAIFLRVALHAAGFAFTQDKKRRFREQAQ